MSLPVSSAVDFADLEGCAAAGGTQMNSVWIFNGDGGHFPSGVFTTRENAEAWIARHCLSGTLTRYPLDAGIYDWAVTQGFFTPRRDDQHTPQFIQRFSSASQEHFHYEDGRCVA
jgi:hypothetical protein